MLGKRNEGLHQLVAEIQQQPVSGVKQREKSNKQLRLLELGDTTLFKAGGLSLTKGVDVIMVSASLLRTSVHCDFDRLENKPQW